MSTNPAEIKVTDERGERTHGEGKGEGTMEGKMIVIDLGKQKRKNVKKLRKGKGRLVADVAAMLEELKAAGTVEGTASTVVVIVERRARRLGLLPG